MAVNDVIVGIDLGTTNSLVAVADERGPRVLRDEAGEGMVPSVLAFDERGTVTIGRQAKAHAVENPTATLFSIKRLMGRGYEELVRSGELAHLPFNVVKRIGSAAERDIAAVEVGGRLMTPPELSAMILREMKVRAEQQLGVPVNKAVITVPAYFDDAQRQATRDAGRIAGLEVLRIVNEPTAAALAYGLGIRGQMATGGGRTLLKMAGECASSEQAIPDAPAQGDATIAVYDLGGGTFDISILQVVEGVFEVLSTHGNTMLGGDDFDREIMGMVHREVQEQFGIQIDSPATRQALRSFAEAVKVRLSTQESAQIEIALDAERVYRRTLSRKELEQMIAPWVERTVDSCRQALRDAKLTPQQIDQVVMVGGSTRIPMVRQRVREVFGREPYTALNPDEVVALGAAVQASILAGQRQDTLLLDVTPLSLGIETMGGAVGKLILRNTRIPCQASEMFSTFVDGQTNVKINVLQGERELAKDCRSLGEFELRGIPPMPAGMPKIRVTFLIDENGILNVSAREERSGKLASIQVIPAHGLTREEVRHMELESYAFAAEDMAAHWLVDLRVQVEFDTHKAEQMLVKAGDRLDPAQRLEIEQAMQQLRELAANSEDSAMLWTALREFDRKTVRLAEVAIVKALESER